MGSLWSAPRKLPGANREAPDAPDAPSIFRAVLRALARRQRSQNSLPAINTVPTSTAKSTQDSPLDTRRLRDPATATFGPLPGLSMSERELQSLLHQTQQSLNARDYEATLEHVNRAKLALLSLNALVPSRDVPQSTLILAREILELAALMSIRRHDHDGFTRYYSQLQPFYDLTPAQLSPEWSHRSKVTGLYLLLLLSQGDYAGFHTVLESLELAVAPTKDGQQMKNGAHGIEIDAFIQYPIKLEQWLMEGSYDRVWSGTKSEKVPSEEYGIFSDVSAALSLSSPCFPRSADVRDGMLTGHVVVGPHRHHPLGDCVVQREGIRVAADHKRQDPAVSGERRQRHRICPEPRLDRP